MAAIMTTGISSRSGSMVTLVPGITGEVEPMFIV